MENIEHFDAVYEGLKAEIEKAQTATNPADISEVERTTNIIIRDLTVALPRVYNDVVSICRERRKQIFRGE